MFEMDKCREEFVQWFKTTQYFCDYFTESDLNLNHRHQFENEIVNSAWIAWQHQQAKVEELQKRVDKALQEIKGAARWIDEDAMDDADFIKGGALRALKRLEQALKGEE